MNGDRATLLRDVLAIAWRAADVVMDVYRGGFQVDYKEKDDPVTRADHEANTLICAALRAAYPSIPIVAEESDPASYEGYAKAEAVWFVDPVDGTREFVAKNGEFAVMIGLAERGKATLGVLVCPATGRGFYGALGIGAFEASSQGNERPIRVSRTATLSEAELLLSRSHRPAHIEEAARAVGFRTITLCGSAGVKATRIAAGEADVFGQPGRFGALWDACAPEALVIAAGGMATDSYGLPIDYAKSNLQNHRGFLATNGLLHEEALGLVRRFRSMAPPPKENP